MDGNFDWSYVYVGPPDHLHVDQGSSFISSEFKSNATAEGIEVVEAPIENPESMSHTERYHGPFRNAFDKLRKDLPKEPLQDILRHAVYCVKNTVGPEGLCPALCVFGTLPKPIRASPSPDQLTRTRAIDSTITLVENEYAKRKVQFSLKYREPYGKERSDLRSLPFGAPVRVYRKASNKWEGPYKFISIDGDTVCLQLPQGRRIFRSYAVKPVHEFPTSFEVSENFTIDAPQHLPDMKISGDILNLLFDCAMAPELVPNSDHYFIASRKKELDGL